MGFLGSVSHYYTFIDDVEDCLRLEVRTTKSRVAPLFGSMEREVEATRSTDHICRVRLRRRVARKLYMLQRA